MKNSTQEKTKPDKMKSLNPPLRPSLTIDYVRYQKYLDGSDMNDAQKREWLDAFWSIMVSFVDMGFGVHPLQQVTNSGPDLDNDACEQNAIIREFITATAADVLNCDTKSRPQTQKNSDAPSGTSKRRSQS